MPDLGTVQMRTDQTVVVGRREGSVQIFLKRSDTGNNRGKRLGCRSSITLRSAQVRGSGNACFAGMFQGHGARFDKGWCRSLYSRKISWSRGHSSLRLSRCLIVQNTDIYVAIEPFSCSPNVWTNLYAPM